jgi:DNA-binding Lrp family transcriptional regulator
MDDLDRTLISLYAAEPRVGVLDRLVASGVVTGWGPDLSPEALGFPVTAFLTLEISQAAGHEAVAEQLAAIPEVLEAHTITGAGDLWCRVVSRSNADLQRVIDRVVAVAGVQRASTVMALAEQVPYRVLPLLDATD